jgi:hypothetical protein
MKDLTGGRLDEILRYAERIGDESLQNCLTRLCQGDKTEYYEEGTETVVMNDFAPKSFYFERRSKDDKIVYLNGGIIYHGPHDGFGSGSAPTFSVSLTPCKGWEIHT